MPRSRVLLLVQVRRRSRSDPCPPGWVTGGLGGWARQRLTPLHDLHICDSVVADHHPSPIVTLDVVYAIIHQPFSYQPSKNRILIDHCAVQVCEILRCDSAVTVVSLQGDHDAAGLSDDLVYRGHDVVGFGLRAMKRDLSSLIAPVLRGGSRVGYPSLQSVT